MWFEVGNKIYVHKPTQELVNYCKSELVLNNPEYTKKLTMGLWLGNTPQNFALYEKVGNDLVLPFGCIFDIYRRYCREYSFKSRIKPVESVSYQSNINPYDYQEKALQEALRARNGVLVMPCGAGKTNCGLEIIARLGVPALWLTHTQDLLNQSMNRAKSVLGINSASYGTITGGKVNIGSGITFATVQTMSRLDLSQYKDVWGCIIVDECMPGCTKIMTIDGEKELHSLNNGDIIASYNGDLKKIEYKPVINTFKSNTHDIVKITMSDGSVVYATSNHPFYVDGKWVQAGELKAGVDYVVQLLWEGNRRNKNIKDKQISKSTARLGVLFKGLFHKGWSSKSNMDRRKKKGSVCSDDGYEFKNTRRNFEKNDGKQSNEKAGSKGESVKTIKGNESSSKNQMRKWKGIDCAATNIRTKVSGFFGCLYGVPNSYKNAKRQWIPNVLQGGYCCSRENDCNRGRRKFSLRHGTQETGREKGYILKRVRVDSVEIQKQTSDGTYGGVCGDGYVYNIEVADNNNYFANGILVHNCHKAVGTPTKVMQFYKVLSQLSCRHKYGLTATPKRSDGMHKAMFALIGNVVCEIKREEVAETTCPVKVRTIETDYMPNLDIALCGDGTINYAGLVGDLTHNEQRFECVCDVLSSLSGATLVLANRVEYLQRLNDRYAGRSVCLSAMGQSKIAKAARKEALRRLNDGEIDCVFASYQLAAEGLDCPNLRYVVFATPEKNERIVEQAAGRVARKYESKDCGFIVDFVDRFGMLLGWRKKRERIYKKMGYEML